MAFCCDHSIFFHAEINEDCYKCEENRIKKQSKCSHINKGPDLLFNNKKYLGMEGEWDVCYDCGKLIRFELTPETKPLTSAG